MAAGVGASRNRVRVALFTDTSVAWAERITAIRSWNGFSYSSSVVGVGSAAFRRSKIA
jgi:hypothetical protein